jgi:hypothetical protein
MIEMIAIDILQSLLDETSASALHNSFERFTALIARPFVLVTERGSAVLDGAAKQRAWFDSYIVSLRAQRITDVVRLATTATLMRDGLLFGTYVSQYLANGTRVIDPFESSVTMRREGNVWQLATVSTSLPDAGWRLILPEAGANAAQMSAACGSGDG